MCRVATSRLRWAPHEPLGMLRLERFQRFVDQVFTVHMMHGDILLGGLEIPDFLDGNQTQLLAARRAEICRRASGCAPDRAAS